MKKTLLALVALTLTAVSYAGDGCGSGGCSKDKAPAPEKAPETKS